MDSRPVVVGLAKDGEGERFADADDEPSEFVVVTHDEEGEGGCVVVECKEALERAWR